MQCSTTSATLLGHRAATACFRPRLQTKLHLSCRPQLQATPHQLPQQLHHGCHQLNANRCIQHLQSSSSPSCRAATGSVRCYSTPGPKPPGPLNHPIPWLCEVQAWPDPAAIDSCSQPAAANVTQHSNGNGSTNGTPITASDSSSSNSVNWPASVAEGQIIDIEAGQLDDVQFDAIMVLAGGLTGDGGLPEWVHRRLDVARGLHLQQQRKPPIVCLGGGTPHKPAILGSTGHVIHESSSCAKYLMDTGVHAGDIYKEVSSYDTVGNAYFGLTIHTLPTGWRRLAVVTSHFHMPRSRALFADLYQLAGSSLFNDPHWYSLTFLSASDEGVFDDYVYNARLGKEAGSLQHWRSVASGLKRLSDFHAWLHAEHLCYAVPRQHEFGKRTIKDPKLLESY